MAGLEEALSKLLEVKSTRGWASLRSVVGRTRGDLNVKDRSLTTLLRSSGERHYCLGNVGVLILSRWKVVDISRIILFFQTVVEFLAV